MGGSVSHLSSQPDPPGGPGQAPQEESVEVPQEEPVEAPQEEPEEAPQEEPEEVLLEAQEEEQLEEYREEEPEEAPAEPEEVLKRLRRVRKAPQRGLRGSPLPWRLR